MALTVDANQMRANLPKPYPKVKVLTRDYRNRKTRMKTPNILIACRIFEKELQAVLPRDVNNRILWVDAALHADLNCLEKNLTECLSSSKASGGNVRMLFGKGCHPDIDLLRNEYCVQMPQVKNCIEAFLGEKLKDLERNSSMIMTPAWVRTWPDMMKALGWDEVDVRINLGRYHRILILDAGLDSLTDEEILSFFDLVQVPIEIEHLDLHHFRNLIGNLLE